MLNLQNHFPDLPNEVFERLKLYAVLLRDWNKKINLVSRKDIDFFEEKHLLPVLPITTWNCWSHPKTVLDVGTGGGLPGIPLAILFPKTHVTLLDSICKKMKAVEAMVHALELKNVSVVCSRLETLPLRCEVVVGRAVTAFSEFAKKAQKNLRFSGKNSGLFYWTGGELETRLPRKIQLFDLETYYKGSFCTGKKIIFCPNSHAL